MSLTSSELDIFENVSELMDRCGVSKKFTHPFYLYTVVYNRLCSHKHDGTLNEKAFALYEILRDIEFVRVVKDSKSFSSISGKPIMIDNKLAIKVYKYGDSDKRRAIISMKSWIDDTASAPDDIRLVEDDGIYSTYSICWVDSGEKLLNLKQHSHCVKYNEDEGYLVYKTNVGKNTIRFAIVQDKKICAKDELSMLTDDFEETHLFS